MGRKKKEDSPFEFNGVKYEPYNFTGSNERRLNSYGEIVEEDAELGVNYFRKDGKEFYNLTGPEGGTKTIEVKDDPFGYQFDRLLNYINSKEKLGLKSSNEKNIIFKTAKIPFMKKKGKTHEYSGVKVDLGNGSEMILVDERLDFPGKIVHLYHELVHAKGYDFPAGKIPSEEEVDEMDKKVQLETISGLRKMYKSMPELYRKIEDNDVKGLSESDLTMFYDKNEEYNPQILRDAVNYAIASRSSFDVYRKDIINRIRQNKPSRLERGLSVFFLVSGALITMIFGGISGNAIGGNLKGVSVVGAILFLIGVFILALNFFRINLRN